MKIRASLRVQALPVILTAVLLTLACDKDYEAQLSVVVPATGTANADSLAADLLSHLSKRFPLKCEEHEAWAGSQGSLELSEVHRKCTDRSSYTYIEVVTSGNDLSIAINKIGGAREPQRFREIRLAAESYLKQAVPGATVVTAAGQ
jgi:hypothetical protein